MHDNMPRRSNDNTSPMPAHLPADPTSTLDRYRLGFEHAAAGMAVADLDGRFVDLNPAFCAMLGYERRALLGHRPQEFIVDYLGGSLDCQLEQMLSGEYEKVTTDASVRCRDGTLVWARASVALIGDRTGDPDFFFVQLQDVTDRVAAAEALLQSQGQLRRTLDSVVTTVAAAVDARDPYTANHQRRVELIADAIGADLGVDTDTREGIRIAAAMHDIGKVSIPAEILAKPARLSAPEFELVKVHPTTGHDIVAAVDFPWPVARMILEHHERLDGSGYPSGLRGDQILLGSRIIAVADVVEAMSSHRPYRPALGIENAINAIRAGRGTLFDPEAVDSCTRCIDAWGGHLAT